MEKLLKKNDESYILFTRGTEWNVPGFNLTCDKQKPFIRPPAV